MVRFLARRYLHGVAARRVWLLFVLLPPVVYLALSGARADRFKVTQDVAIAKDSPVASTSNPVDFILMNQVASRPESFFQDNLALREIYADLYGGAAADKADERYRILVEAANRDLKLTMADDRTATIAYYGGDRLLGETLVGYYARRLVKRAQAGLVRQNQQAMKKDMSKGLTSLMGGTAAIRAIGLNGALKVEAHRAMWRPERAAPLVQVVIISLFVVLILLGVLEWSDPAFKSERQIARYLGVPILGSLPDLTLISDALAGKGVK